jgi:hypothetical protein
MPLRTPIAAIAFISLAWALACAARATTIDFLVPSTTKASAACSKIPKTTCSTTAYFQDQSLDDQNDDENISSLFVDAFDAWNKLNAMDAKWTLKFGGDPGGAFSVFASFPKVTDPDPTCNGLGPKGGTCGGLLIRIALNKVPLPAVGKNQVLGWAQGVYSNYENNGAKTVAAFYEMDVTTGACSTTDTPYCAPLYPFLAQPNYKFADAPAFQFLPPSSSQAFFNADAYLSLADYGTHTLTVYDGVSYGYRNAIPEPPTRSVLSAGFAALLIVRRLWGRRTAAATRAWRPKPCSVMLGERRPPNMDRQAVEVRPAF